MLIVVANRAVRGTTRGSKPAAASGDSFVMESRSNLAMNQNPGLGFQALQADPLRVDERMFRRQHRRERFGPNRLDSECGVHIPRRMQQAEVELTRADRLKPLVALDVFQPNLHVRTCTPKAGSSVGDHADRGHGHKAKPDASGLALTRTPGGMHSVGSVVQDDTNALQESTAGRGERDRSLGTYEELDADLALKPTNFLTEMGLCNAQPQRRSSEMELLGDRDKKSQMSIFHYALI
jgi:hypothetical protein